MTTYQYPAACRRAEAVIYLLSAVVADNGEIYTMNADGSNGTKKTVQIPGSFNDGPDWEKKTQTDGTKIAFKLVSVATLKSTP